MTGPTATLYFLCGKMAAGKSTLARDRDAVLLVQDEWLLHYIDISDEVCKRQLRRRSEGLPAGTVWTTDAEFDAVTAYFESPAPDERFNIVRHERS